MTTSPSPEQPSVQPLPAYSPRRLHRSGTDRMLGGVCGGLAEYTGVDVVLWRVGFVAVALMGAGILAYVLLWILMPGSAATSGAPFESAVQRLHTAVNDAVGPRNQP
jgi:phage shock protein PspC (stress-responsive transcriptional regulator)